jgi:ParB-like chromosome segregation protein Spo0J
MPVVEELTLGAIDEEDRTFRLSVGGSMADLERSIAAVGQTSPLQVRLAGGERYQLVTGFRRVEVLRLLGRVRVVASVHDMDELPDPKAAQLAVFDNLGVREYNLVEKAMAVELLLTLGGMSEAEVVQKVLHALGLQSHGQALERLRRLLVLEKEQLKTIAEEGWPARSVLPICAWRADARQAFFEVIQAVKPGANKLAELVGWLEEIALREEKAIGTVMVDLRLRSMAKESSLPPQERLNMVREAVRRARNPTLTKMTRRAAELVAKLNLEPYVAVRPPEGFEGDDYEGRFSFSSPEELKRIGRLLVEASDNQAAGELRELLSEGLSEEEATER